MAALAEGWLVREKALGDSKSSIFWYFLLKKVQVKKTVLGFSHFSYNNRPINSLLLFQTFLVKVWQKSESSQHPAKFFVPQGPF